MKQFVGILDKVSAQAEGKTVAQVAPKSGDDDGASDEADANEMIAQHEYFTLQDGKSVLVFAYTGEEGEGFRVAFQQHDGENSRRAEGA